MPFFHKWNEIIKCKWPLLAPPHPWHYVNLTTWILTSEACKLHFFLIVWGPEGKTNTPKYIYKILRQWHFHNISPLSLHSSSNIEWRKTPCGFKWSYIYYKHTAVTSHSTHKLPPAMTWRKEGELKAFEREYTFSAHDRFQRSDVYHSSWTASGCL